MSHYFRIAKGLLFGYSSSLLNFLLFLILASQLEIGKYAVVMIAIAIGSFLAPLLNLGSEKVLVPSVVAAASADGVAKILSRNFMRRFYMLLLVYFGIGLVVCIRADSEDSLALILLSYWAVLLGFYPTAWYDYKGILFVNVAWYLLRDCSFYWL